MNMPGTNPDLDDRLARLAARRAASSGSNTTPAPDPTAPDRNVARRPARKRRAHPAAASRILAAGLSTSAFLSLMAAFAARAPAAGTPVVATAPPRANIPGAPGTVRHRKPKIVTKVRHHTVYVDQYGHSYSSLAAAAAAATPPSDTTGPIASPSAVAPPPAPTSLPRPAPPPTTVYTPPPPPPPPPCSGTKCP
jgi:hypothetical protein